MTRLDAAFCPECGAQAMRHWMGEQWVCDDCDFEATVHLVDPETYVRFLDAQRKKIN